MGNLWSWLANGEGAELDYSIPAGSDNGSEHNSDLITSAVEILARQRLWEQLNDQLSAQYYRGVAIEDTTGPEWAETIDTRHSRETRPPPDDSPPARVSYFITIRDIFVDLLRRNELRLSFPRLGNLNMLEQASSSEASSDECGEDLGSPSYLRSPAPSRAKKKRVNCQLPLSITPTADVKLKESYTELLDDVCRRSGRQDTPPLSGNNSSPTRDRESKCSTTEGQMLRVLREREQGSVRGVGLTCAQKAAISNRYLPNQKRLVDYVRAKTFCVGYFNDGLLTATQDHKIRLYQPRSTRRRYTVTTVIDVPFVGWSVLDFAITPDGRSVAYSTWDDNIYKCVLPCEGRNADWIPLGINTSEANRIGVFSIRFNSSGDEIVAGASDGHLYVYSMERAQTVLDVRAHDDDANAVCFADRSSHIILSGSDDGLCKAWDRRTMGDFSTATPVGVFAGHKDGITFIDSRGDDRYLLTNSKDQTIKLWDLRHFASKKAIVNSKKAAAAQHWDYRWQNFPLASFSSGEGVEGDCSIATIRGHSVLQTLIRARFSPEHTGKRFIYSGCATGKCVVYDLLNPAEKRVYGTHGATVRDCVWHPEENEIVTSSWDGKTYVWRFDQRSERKFNGDGSTDEEESCDEKYEPIQRRVLRRRRRKLE